MLDPDKIIYNRYRIERLVGHGAMGAVYAAIDLRLGHTVALKHTLIPGPQGAEALDREGQILARLHHPGLPTVSDSFVAAEGQCIVMAFVPGPTLADLLDERGAGFPTAIVLTWADQILAALEYMHGQHPPVLHRDIKPQNLKLTPEGQVILLDFGLARGALFQTQVAGRRSVVGYTLPYAPIEQVRGLDTDPRSDLFALAGTLYHLLIGSAPPDALERAANLLTGGCDPLKPPAAICPETPQALSAILVQALAIDPNGRPPNATAMRAALTRAYDRAEPVVYTAPQRLNHPPVPIVPPAPQRQPRLGRAARRLWGWMIALAAASLAVQIGGPVILRSSQPIPIERATTNTSTSNAYTAEFENGWIGFTNRGLAAGATSTALAAQSTPSPIIGAIYGDLQRYVVVMLNIYWGACLTYNADGDLLYVNSHKGVLMIDAQTGAIHAELAGSKENVGGLALTSDGQNLAFGRRDSLQIRRVADGQISTFFPSSDEARWVDFTRDGRHMAFSDAKGAVHVLKLIDGYGLANWDTLAPANGPQQIRALAFAPDGETLAIAQGQIWLRQVSDGMLIHSGDWGDTQHDYMQANALAFSPDGKTLAIGYTNGVIELVQVGSWELKASLDQKQSISALAFAPDGKALAAGYAEGSIHIWTLRSSPLEHMSFTNPVTLLVGTEPILDITFSPDGLSLATINSQALHIWRRP